MIDAGLLLSVLAVAAAVYVARWRYPRTTVAPGAATDRMLAPAIAGLFVGRIAFMLLDDPRGLLRPFDVLLLRGGIEFWPGVVAAAAVAARQARRDGVPAGERLRDLLPVALVGYAAYEATCIVRDGCFGPVSRVGLRPPQSAVTQFPVGWAIAAALIGLGGVLRGRDAPSWRGVAWATAGVAAVRLTASIWLPSIGSGFDRLAAANVGFLAFGAILGAATVRSSTARPDPTG